MEDNKIIHLKTISGLHRHHGVSGPRHPLVSVIDLLDVDHSVFAPGDQLQMDFYVIACKKFKGEVHYGRSAYDFEEGSVMFTAPGQVVSTASDVAMEEGWALFFHPDLVNASALGRKMHEYAFFRYDTHEALHVSEEEKRLLRDIADKIQRECAQNMDQHTQHLIVSNIELLLGYCTRFYDRQFLTRAKVNNGIVQDFERLLHVYFDTPALLEAGLPEVKYFAGQLNVSPNYLTDVLHKFTGKTTQEHIHLHLVEKAKSLLWSTEDTVSEIAYRLGFEHASHFNKLFKAKTGLTPGQYRHLN